ncbi:MAG TPA: hypothetical protein VNA15_01950, partial [Candidatus Angelobacter sp.]|nr:hypothetical protein [Candidatus Angelobacter sp.]
MALPMRTGGKFWSVCLTFMIVLALGSGPLIVGATSTPYSWNPKVPCTPTIVKITDITNNSTGTTSYNTSPFSPGLTSPVGLAKRWLAPGATPPGWVSPGPPCTITDSQGKTVSIFVEIDHVRVTSAYVTETDCSSTFDTVNGGGNYATSGTKCDVTANLYSNPINSCTSTTDPGCWYKIHTEFDQDWQGAGYCGPGTVCDPAQAQSQIVGGSTYIDVQGFVYWDPAHVTEQWHAFSGWELHPLTAWRISGSVQSADYSVSLNPTSLIMQAGASATSTVTLSSLNGFTGTITLGTSVSPSGPTASLSSTTVVLSSG